MFFRFSWRSFASFNIAGCHINSTFRFSKDFWILCFELHHGYCYIWHRFCNSKRQAISSYGWISELNVPVFLFQHERFFVLFSRLTLSIVQVRSGIFFFETFKRRPLFYLFLAQKWLKLTMFFKTTNSKSHVRLIISWLFNSQPIFSFWKCNNKNWCWYQRLF